MHPEEKRWQPVTEHWSGKFLRVKTAGRWEYVERVGVDLAVVLIAETPEGAVLFTEQYRPPLRARVIEFPAGLVGDTAEFRGEPALVAAQRELREETGYEASKLEIMAQGPVTPGLTNESIMLVLCHGLRKVAEGGGDESEDIIVHEVMRCDVDDWLAQQQEAGFVVDPKIYAGLYFLKQDEHHGDCH